MQKMCLKNTTITVAIVSYNYGHLVGHAIESVLCQTRLPEEIIVVDDGSHDGACEVAKKYGVKYIDREKNLGTIENFNDILMNRVKTNRVMFLGADNWLRPDTLERLNKEKADIISYDYALSGDRISKRGIKSSEYKDGYRIRRFAMNTKSIKSEITRHNIIHGSALYNVKLAQKVGGYKAMRNYNNGRRLAEDWGLWRRMLLKGNATHKHIPVPFLYYRRHRFNNSILK